MGAPHSSVRLLSVLCTCCCFLLQSCNQSVDLTAVRALAQSAQNADASFTALAQDYHASCVRSQEWLYLLEAESWAMANATPTPHANFQKQRSVRKSTPARGHSKGDPPPVAGIAPHSGTQPPHEVKTAPGSKTSASPKPTASPETQRSPTPAPKTSPPTISASFPVCDTPEITAAVARWSAWNHLLLSYYVALGSIAGNAPDDSLYGIKDAAVALQNSGTIGNTPTTQKEVSEVSSAAITAVNAYFDAKRRNAIAEYAAPNSAGTAFVNTTTAALIRVANDYKSAALTSELTATNTYYQTNVQWLAQGGSQGVLQIHSYINDWSAADAAIEARVDAANAYIQALQSMQTAYSAITAALAANKPDEMSSVVTTYVGEFNGYVTTINQALAKGGSQ
jgi:hypothetical protein